MKKTHAFLFIIGIFFPQFIFPQYILLKELNHPRGGDVLSKQQVAFKDPGRSGKDVLWDFSQLTPVEREQLVLPQPLGQIDWKNINVASLAVQTRESHRLVSYWLDEYRNQVTGSEQEHLFRYNPSGDSLLVWGYENPGIRIENSLPEVWLRYPLAFKDKFSSYFCGNGLFYEQTDVTVMGLLEVEADAYGTMILPGGDSLQNVLRVTSLKTQLDDRQPLVYKNIKKEKSTEDSVKIALKKNKDKIYTEVIRWYAEGYRYPVFETWKTYTDKQGKRSDENYLAFVYRPEWQQEDYLDRDPRNQALAEAGKKNKAGNKNKNKSAPAGGSMEAVSLQPACKLFPNPTNGELQVEVALTGETRGQMIVYSIQGAVLYRTPAAQRSGIWQETLDLRSLAKGSYLLHIICGEETLTEKIIKN